MQRIQDADILLVDDTPELLALVSRALAGAGAIPACARRTAAPRRAGPLPPACRSWSFLTSTCRTATGFHCSANSTRAARCRCCSSRPATPTPTGCSALGLGADDYLTKPFPHAGTSAAHPAHPAPRLPRRSAAERRGPPDAGGAQRRPERRRRLRPGRPHADADRHRARTAAKARCQPRPHRHVRRALPRCVERRLLRVRKYPRRAHPPFARKDRGRPRPPALDLDRARARLQAGGGGKRMRSLVKLVRRYVLAGVGIALGVLILNVVIPFGVIFAVAYRS